MKKIRVLIIVIFVSLLCMGAGYAFWGKFLPVYVLGNSGQFNMRISSATVVTPNPKTPVVATAKVAPAGKTATLTLSNLYPGAKQDFLVVLTNGPTPGTISTRLSNFILTDAKGDPRLLDNIYVYITDVTGTKSAVEAATFHGIAKGGSYAYRRDNKAVWRSGLTTSYTFRISISMDSAADSSLMSLPFSFILQPTFSQAADVP